MDAAGPVLVSVGYAGRDLPELVGLLRDCAVSVLVDVRRNPVSRKPGLSRTRLSQGLAHAGIGYRHARALGNPRDNRAAFATGDPRHGLEVYGRLLDEPPAAQELAALARLLASERVAVLCVERSADRCHRQAVVARVAASTDVPVLRLE